VKTNPGSDATGNEQIVLASTYIVPTMHHMVVTSGERWADERTSSGQEQSELCKFRSVSLSWFDY